jgi:hypothetical protein
MVGEIRWFDVLKTVIESATKSVLAQLGDVLQKITEADNAEWYQHVGFISRPSKAVSGQKAAECIAVGRRDRYAVIASRDLRGQDLAGSLADGETCLYAGGSTGTAQGRILIKADGSINIYSRQGNTSAGQGMAIMVTPSSDTISIVNSTGKGIIINSDGVTITAGDSGLVLQSNGDLKLIAKAKAQIDGAGIVLGSVALTGVNSALKGVTGVAGTPSLKVLIE